MQETFYNCLDFCKVYQRLPYFYITGGDPILHPHFWKLLAMLKEYDIPFTILGNPFHLTDEVCRKLKEYGCQKYQLSLDGMRATHDWFRKPGSFDGTLEKISCIKKAGIRSVIMTTVSGTNRKEIPDMIDTVVKAGVDIFAFARYCPTSEEKDTGMTPQEYRELLDICYEKFQQYEAAGFRTAGLEMYLQTGLQTFGSAKWNNTGIIANLRNARNVSCCPTAGGVLQLPAEKTEIFMRQTHNVGKRCRHGIF